MPRTGNYMNQERLLSILTAANNILLAIDAIRTAAEPYRHHAGGMISVDTLFDLINHNAPAMLDILTIGREMGHFLTRSPINETARAHMATLRATRREGKVRPTGIDLNANGSDYSEMSNAFAAKVQTLKPALTTEEAIRQEQTGAGTFMHGQFDEKKIPPIVAAPNAPEPVLSRPDLAVIWETLRAAKGCTWITDEEALKILGAANLDIVHKIMMELVENDFLLAHSLLSDKYSIVDL